MAVYGNHCFTVQELYPDNVDNGLVQLIVGGLYLFVFILGVVGNMFTCFCVLWKKVDVRIHPAFVLCLSVSDLAILLICLPFTVAQAFMGNWEFGDFMCKVIPILQTTATIASSFTLSAIAVERYRTVGFMQVVPSGLRLDRHLYVALVIWSCSLAVSVAYGSTAMKLQRIDHLCGLFCVEDWPFSWGKQATTTCTFIAHFVVPVSVLAYAYGMLGRKVNEQLRFRREHSSQPQDASKRQRIRSWVFITILFAAFALPWLPYYISHIILDFKLGKVDHLTLILVHLLAMTNTIYNPIIYCWFNADFRKTMAQHFISRNKSSARSVDFASTRRHFSAGRTVTNNQQQHTNGQRNRSMQELDQLINQHDASLKIPNGTTGNDRSETHKHSAPL